MGCLSRCAHSLAIVEREEQGGQMGKRWRARAWFSAGVRKFKRKRLRGGVHFRGLEYSFAGPNNEAAGSRADVVKRGKQVMRVRVGTGVALKTSMLMAGNDLSGFDEVLKIASGGFERDGVARPDIAERAEKSVAVTGESDVAGCSGQGGFGDVADGAAQNGMGIALNDDGFEVKTRNLDLANHAAFEEERRRQLWAASSLLQLGFEFRLFVGLIGMRVHNNVNGIAEGEEADGEEKIGREAKDSGACAPRPSGGDSG